MIRLSILAVFLLCLWLYAFRNWFVSLCGLILLTVLTQNSNLPRTIAGIQGFNPWNASLLIITVAWFVQRVSRTEPWRVPRLAVGIILAYVAVILVAYAQLVFNAGSLPPGHRSDSFLAITSDYLINPLKYFWVALLLADGCFTRARVKLAIGAIVGLGVLYALLVLKNVPITVLFGGGNFMAVRGLIDKVVGLHANDMGKVLALTLWGVFVAQSVWRGWHYRLAAIVSATVSGLGLALCFSRNGYATFLATGAALACIRWRKLLLIGPVALIILCLVFPSIVERSVMGFDSDPSYGEGTIDWNQVSAGRTGNLWPPTIEAIGESLLFGHGRLAMLTTSAYEKILATEGVVPTSPHNGYLTVLIESGLLGMLIVGAFYIGVLLISCSLLVKHADPLVVAVGGLGFVHSTGCLVTALAGGTLLPDQGMLGTMCAFGVTLRVWCTRDCLTLHAVRVRPSANSTAFRRPRHVVRLR